MGLAPFRFDQPPHAPAPLPTHWVLVLSISGAIGVIVGGSDGLPAGLLATLAAMAVLHSVIK